MEIKTLIERRRELLSEIGTQGDEHNETVIKKVAEVEAQLAQAEPQNVDECAALLDVAADLLKEDGHPAETGMVDAVRGFLH